MTPGACARIRLSAIQHNLKLLCSLAPATRVMAVVKGNAYGHGMLPVARILSAVDCLAVARLSEARQLRDGGIRQSLLLLGGVVDQHDMGDASALDVALCVHNSQQLDWLEGHSGPGFTVWLKIDTGMNRLGFDTRHASELIARLRSCDAVNKLGLMTHFGNADDPTDATTQLQLDRFREVLQEFDGDISIANSAGLLGFSTALNEFASACGERQIWIRPGVSLYGISPLRGRVGAELGLQPAMQFESRLISIRPLRTGDRVGYGGAWQTHRPTRLGTVAAGYGDGYPPAVLPGTPVLINGREVPVVGLISMDLMAVDLGPDASEGIGDRVVLWGDDLPVERVAQIAGTGAYQLVTGVTHREAAVYAD